MTTWNAGTNLVGSNPNRGTSFITKNKVFLIGGFVNGVLSNKTYSADIDSEGVIGAWSDTGNDLPVAMVDCATIITKTRVYIVATNEENHPNNTDRIFFSEIQPDGTLGLWQDNPQPFPTTTRGGLVCVYDNYVYVQRLQGTSQTASREIFKATIDEQGILGEFTGTSKLIPSFLWFPELCVIKNKLYLFGGRPTLSFHACLNVVYVSNIDASGNLGDFYSGNDLSQITCASKALITKTRVHLIGSRGTNGANIRCLMTAPIDNDGVVGTWTNLTNLPSDRGHSPIVVTSSRLYILGGSSTNTSTWTPFEGGSNDYV